MGKLNQTKLKANLKLTLERLKLLKRKRAGLAQNASRDVAALLAKGKDEEARIRVEAIVKDDCTVEAYEVLELFCELLMSRLNMLALSKSCPAELHEAVCTLMYVAQRHAPLKELVVVRKLLGEHYGKAFVAAAGVNKDGCVNGTVVQKLSVVTPDVAVVHKYMSDVARKHQVAWSAPCEPDADTGVFPETVATVAPAAAAAATAAAPAAVAPVVAATAPARAPIVDDVPFPTPPAPADLGDDFPQPPPGMGGGGGGGAAVAATGAAAVHMTVDTGGGGGGGGGGYATAAFPSTPTGPAGGGGGDGDGDIDDLAARFAALKRG